ncbi:hypothetical protein Taro_018935 [Colocasia esculenta]|uniref:Rab-GAP TBC domain-containing protein n=1 Tax=Colocasia esculenta TaxID=4460 RepID=A0A843UV24_COLES|nr:hypothetical protein [Colocasia esculenta]
MKTLRRSHTSSASSSSNALSSAPSSSSASSWVHLRSLLIIASSPPAHDRYDLTSTEAERNAVKRHRRKEYIKLRHHCKRLLMHGVDGYKELKTVARGDNEESPSFEDDSESPSLEDVYSARQSFSIGASPDTVSIEENAPQSCIGGSVMEEISSDQFVAEPMFIKRSSLNVGRSNERLHRTISHSSSSFMEEDKSSMNNVGASATDADSSDSESSVEEPEVMHTASVRERIDEDYFYAKMDPPTEELSKPLFTDEDYATWQRIIRLDAIRANPEWVPYSSTQTVVSQDKAHRRARSVGLKDYDDLDPCRIYHAARLVAVLEAYAIYDSEIGYCQGMSDLLSPIVAVIEDDSEAFWCFVAFMRKARNNFRLDEVGIRRQLNIVSKIIRHKDSHLYRHLEKLQAEDCFFVYRMVVVLFRRELSFEQTLCLWEVMWADQAAIRAGIGKSAWGRIRQRAPPTDDLLLYAIAACVLQKRKLIIEKYSSMDEILRECNDMAGQVDVWRLLDDAHDLVVTLHDKI